MWGAFTAFFAAAAWPTPGMLDANPFLGDRGHPPRLDGHLDDRRRAPRADRLPTAAPRPRLVPLITAIGASLFLQYTLPRPLRQRSAPYPEHPGARRHGRDPRIRSARPQVVVIVAAIVLMVVLYFFIKRTRTGRAMRAVSEDKDTAALMGINVDRMIVTTFAIGGSWPARPASSTTCSSTRSTASWASCRASRPSPRRSSAASATSSAPCSAASSSACSSRSARTCS